MGDRKITLLELHFDGDTQFGPSGNLGDLAGGSEGSEEESESDVEGEGGGGAARGVLGLLAIVLVVVAAKKLVGSRGEETESFEA